MANRYAGRAPIDGRSSYQKLKRDITFFIAQVRAAHREHETGSQVVARQIIADAVKYAEGRN